MMLLSLDLKRLGNALGKIVRLAGIFVLVRICFLCDMYDVLKEERVEWNHCSLMMGLGESMRLRRRARNLPARICRGGY